MSEYNQQIQTMVSELCDAFTQKSLSSLTGVPQGTLSKIKNGKLENFSFKKADAIRSFYLSWKQKPQLVRAEVDVHKGVNSNEHANFNTVRKF